MHLEDKSEAMFYDSKLPNSLSKVNWEKSKYGIVCAIGFFPANSDVFDMINLKLMTRKQILLIFKAYNQLNKFWKKEGFR